MLPEELDCVCPQAALQTIIVANTINEFRMISPGSFRQVNPNGVEMFRGNAETHQITEVTEIS